MSEGSQTIVLRGGAYYVTEHPEDACRVLSGSIHVYLVPWEDGRPGRRSLLCTMADGLFPAFSYMDKEHRHWRFLVTAAEECAELVCLEGFSTGPLRRRFLTRIGIEDSGQEGYEDLLVERYRLNLVQEDGYLLRTDKEKQSVQARIDQMIAAFFRKERSGTRENGEQALYQVMAELCHRQRLPIAPYEKVQACCREEVTVEEIARVSHIPCRSILLEEGWHKADAGPLLVRFGQTPAACIPKGRGGYLLYRSGEKPIPLTEDLAEQCSPRAWMLYRPFPPGDDDAQKTGELLPSRSVPG